MKKLFSFLLFAASLGIWVSGTAQNLATVAGNGAAAFSGDGGSALAAALDTPLASAFDSLGNLYIADCSNNCIRIVHQSGIIETFAGVPVVGPGSYGGDGGPASAAHLNHPKGLLVDPTGNVYISDAGNAAIRIVRPSGIITTFAGTPLVPGPGGDGGMATAANLGDPNGLARDTSGNIYIADAGNHRIRIVRPSGIIQTYAGNGTVGSSGDGTSALTAQLNYPMSVAFDTSGNLYIADSAAARIRIVRPSGIINTFAGTGTAGFGGDNGLATAAKLHAPTSVIVDPMQNVHIADGSNARLRIVHNDSISSPVGTGVPGFNGDGPGSTSQVNFPTGFAMDDSGRLYVSDSHNGRVRRFLGHGGFPGLSVTPVEQPDGAMATYPNPSRGIFIVKFISSYEEKVHYAVTNMLGEKVTEMDGITNQPKELQLSTVSPGMYFVSATTAHGARVEKVIISH